MRGRRCRRILLAVPLVVAAAACGGDDGSSSSGSGAPTGTTTAATEVEWEQHVPGGDCQCADGSEFSFWSRQGDPDKVVLYFQGGGACFSPETCSFTDGTYTVQADGSQATEERAGIFDLEDPDNPFRDWSFVFVPYCTGDVHLGDAAHDYGDGLVVQHRGFVNASAGLDHLVEEFADANEVFVTGSSAGGVPAPLFAGLVSDAMPDASVAALADASGAYPDNPPVNEAIGSLWGTFGNVPDWPENEGLEPRDWSIPGLFVQAGLHDPDLRFARYDNAYDETQQSFAELSAIASGDLQAIIRDNEAGIEEQGIEVASYLAPGTDHTILGDDGMYELEVEGTSFVDWLTRFVEGEAVPDVSCVDCGGPADA